MIDYLKTVEKWCIQELWTEGPSDGNPFMDYEIAAEFKSKSGIGVCTRLLRWGRKILRTVHAVV